jgi:hypothetical protein
VLNKFNDILLKQLPRRQSEFSMHCRSIYKYSCVHFHLISNIFLRLLCKPFRTWCLNKATNEAVSSVTTLEQSPRRQSGFSLHCRSIYKYSCVHLHLISNIFVRLLCKSFRTWCLNKATNEAVSSVTILEQLATSQTITIFHAMQVHLQIFPYTFSFDIQYIRAIAL